MPLKLKQVCINLGIGSDPKPSSNKVFRNLSLKRVIMVYELLSCDS